MKIKTTTTKKNYSFWLSILLIFIVALVIATFNQSLVMLGFNQYFKAEKIQMNCVEWQLTWPLGLHIYNACIEYPSGKVNVINASWLYAKNNIDIEQVDIHHVKQLTEKKNPAVSNEVDGLFPIVLPSVIPDVIINIDKIAVNSPLLIQPALFKVTQTIPNQVIISSFNNPDINALITFAISDKIVSEKSTGAKNTLNAEIHWRLQDFVDLVPHVNQASLSYLSGLSLDSPIHSRFIFDGRYIQNNNVLTSQYTATQLNCEIFAQGAGDINSTLDIVTMEASVDLRDFEINGQLDHCFEKTGAVKVTDNISVEKNQPEPFTLKLPTIIYFDNQTLQTEKITIAGGNSTVNNTALIMQLNMQLTDLKYSMTNDFTANYRLAVQHGSGINLSSKGDVAYKKGEGVLKVEQSDFSSASFTYSPSKGESIQGKQLKGSFTAVYQIEQGFSVQGNARVDELLIVMPDTAAEISDDINHIKMSKVALLFTLTADDFSDINIELDNTISSINYSDYGLKEVSNEFTFNVKKLTQLEGTGQSKVNQFSVNSIKSNIRNNAIDKITIDHDIQFNLEHASSNMLNGLHSQHKFVLDDQLKLALKVSHNQAELSVAPQYVLALNPLVVKSLPDLFFEHGKISALINTDLNTMKGTGSFSLENINFKYSDYHAQGLNYKSPFSFDKNGFDLTANKLSLQTLNAGIVVTDIQTSIKGENTLFKAENTVGNVLKGQFILNEVWLDNRSQQSLLTLEKIDLAELAKLEKQSGINITGKVGGDLPLTIDQNSISITDGLLVNQTPGQLTIVDNTGFEAIKSQQPELSHVLSLLQNLTIDELSSTVNLKPEGWLFLDLAIEGLNPEQHQKVNFNYTHQENIITLLKSLRLADMIEDKVIKKL